MTLPRLPLCLALFSPLLLLAQEEKPEPVAPTIEQRLADAPKRLKQLEGGRLELGGIILDPATRRIEVPCKVLHGELPIEYLLVQETGKDHETVLTTAISPLDLQVALLLTHYTPGSTGMFRHLPQGEPLPMPEVAPKTTNGHRVQLTVVWQVDGQEKRQPISEWYQNSDTRQPPEIDAWLFTGSAIDARGFAAEADGSIIAVYADRLAMFNSPAAGNHRDDLWISRPAVIPPEETPVTLVIEPATP
ncbi:MAG: hypothetical protein KDK99_15465 [Verrucomicrobiales bacterium]|nr:hypothetical protein [Verrucomicrobiales bacterium]